MSTPERPIQEPQPRIVRLGESFHLNPQPVDPMKRGAEEAYPHFFTESIIIPELDLTGELTFYADGYIASEHVTPLGPIEFPAKISGSAVAFNRLEGGPLMLSVVLSGRSGYSFEGLHERQVVVKTEQGTYSSNGSVNEGKLSTGVDSYYSSVGAHRWDSQESLQDETGRLHELNSSNVTAYFPNDIEKLKELEVTLL